MSVSIHPDALFYHVASFAGSVFRRYHLPQVYVASLAGSVFPALSSSRIYFYQGASRSISQLPSSCNTYRNRSCSLLLRPCQNSTKVGFTM